MDARLERYLESIGASEESLSGWTIKIAQRDGRDVGVTIVKGSEIHMLAFEPGAMSRRNIIAHMAPILDEYGFITTRVPVGEKDHKLRQILGFEKTWEDASFTYWAATTLPFSKKVKSCQ